MTLEGEGIEDPQGGRRGSSSRVTPAGIFSPRDAGDGGRAMEVRTRICILRRPYAGRTVMLQSCESLIPCRTIIVYWYSVCSLEECAAEH